VEVTREKHSNSRARRIRSPEVVEAVRGCMGELAEKELLTA
jgi:hypothetical protein